VKDPHVLSQLAGIIVDDPKMAAAPVDEMTVYRAVRKLANPLTKNTVLAELNGSDARMFDTINELEAHRLSFAVKAERFFDAKEAH
jgi:ABC-type uncharacterized transport system YnjBCD substrate-binding protein